MPQAKLTTFLVKNGDAEQNNKKRKRRPKQASIDEMSGVVKLPKMSGHATLSELRRLLADLEGSSSDETIIHAMKQLACYEITVDQLEAVPLGKRIKQLAKQKCTNAQVQQQAERLLQKMRQDVTAACERSGAKPAARKKQPVLTARSGN